MGDSRPRVGRDIVARKSWKRMESRGQFAFERVDGGQGPTQGGSQLAGQIRFITGDEPRELSRFAAQSGGSGEAFVQFQGRTVEGPLPQVARNVGWPPGLPPRGPPDPEAKAEIQRGGGHGRENDQ